MFELPGVLDGYQAYSNAPTEVRDATGACFVGDLWRNVHTRALHYLVHRIGPDGAISRVYCSPPGAGSGSIHAHQGGKLWVRYKVGQGESAGSTSVPIPAYVPFG